MAMLRWLAIATLSVLITGCAQLGYYAQAAEGQYSLWQQARTIDDLLGDPATDAGLKNRLQTARAIRAFAVSELGLPDNDSYHSYVALHRPYVLWNIVATPELSLTPVQWCFPIAGCVSYRGYYSEAAAQAYAAQLRAEHFDVQVGGVPAYSTLGWFSDPLLSTFINYSDAELARMIFHELAHQLIYVPGDSRFNEAFATAVEEAGVQCWLERNGTPASRSNYALYRGRRQDFMALLLKYRTLLQTNYAGNSSVSEKRQEKTRIFAALKDEYQVLKAKWGGYAGYERWFAAPLTNAHLASIATYHDFLPAFQHLLEKKKTFRAFYVAVQELAQLNLEQRHHRLAQLAVP